MSLSVEVAGKTDVGCVRQNNEDNFGYDARHGIFVVCDGMGGMAAGEVASKMAVDTVLTYFREAARNKHYPVVGKNYDGVSERANALASAIQLANEAVRETAKAHPAQAGMGSTMVAVLVRGAFFSVGHVGDSRIYLVRSGDIQQLTNDHSLVMEQVRRGLITLAEARESDMQNIIIRALGSDDTVEPDLDDMMAMPDDVLLLCSDGLTRHVPDDKLFELISNAPSLEAACEQLIQAAKDGGGSDNITCVLVRMVEQPWYRRFLPGGSRKWQNSI
jgi:protein phosphatase